MQQHCSKYFARVPLSSDPGIGSKDRNSTFSEHGHVAYKIKGNHECSNRVRNILLASPRLRSKGQNSFCSEHVHVAYQIKWNRADPDPGVKRLKFNFSRTWSYCI